MLEVLDTPDAKVTLEEGNSGSAVVSFTGVKFGSVESGEFKKTLSATDEINDVYYVFDMHRRWYNGSHQTAISDALNLSFGDRSIGRVITIGNSMGGAGSIAYAGSLRNCHRSIAFCPQSSVDPKVVPGEPRWREYRDGITDWTASDLASFVRPDVSYFIFYGRDDVLDMVHANRYLRAGGDRLKVFLVPDCGHDVAFEMKKRGFLTPVIRKLLTEQEPDVDTLLAMMPGVSLMERSLAA